MILDIHKDGAFYKDKIDENAKLIKSTSNIRDNAHIVSGLEPNTQYYIAIFSIERNQVFGYSETSFTTLPLLEDEEDVLIEDINE